MPYDQEITDLAQRAGTEVKAVRAEILALVGLLANLDTDDKTDIVSAINELQAEVDLAIGGGASELDDLTDVVISSPATGHIVRHNGTNFVNVLGTTHYEVAGAAASAQAAAIAASQPLDSDLTNIAALTTTSYGRAFLELANQAALMSLLASASETAQGKVELATVAETLTGTDTARAVTAAGVQAKIDALIDSAPGLLNTLDEIAAALGDDPNFATTITTALAGKQPVDSDLTAIAGLSTTSYGRAFLELADQAALMALIPAASETVQGKIELATQAEVSTGTDAVRAVTPATLRTVYGNPETDYVTVFEAALV